MSTILIVDDEEGFLQITRIVLQRAGFATLTASSGAEGLRLLAEHKPDLMILDEMMPGMTGSDVCVQVKRDPDLQRMPIVMHTASFRLRNPDHVREIGADAVLFKPSLPQQIIDTVTELLKAAV